MSTTGETLSELEAEPQNPHTMTTPATSPGMTIKQMHRAQFHTACEALRMAYETNDSSLLVRASIAVHSLKGRVPRSLHRMIPKP